MPVSVPVEGKAHPAAGLAFSYVSEKSHEESQENSNASVSEKKKKLHCVFKINHKTWNCKKAGSASSSALSTAYLAGRKLTKQPRQLQSMAAQQW